MKELNPRLRLHREDVEAVPLLHRADRRPFVPLINRFWTVVVMERGDEFESWQVGRLVWVDAEDRDVGRRVAHGRVVGLVVIAALTGEEAALAERAVLWRLVRSGLEVQV